MERCTLCGGKLVNGKCTECGLDNTRNDKKYHLNMHNEKGTLLHRGDCEDHLNRDSGWQGRLRERQKRLSGETAGKAAGDRQGGGTSPSSSSSSGAPAAQTAQQLRQKRKKELKKRRETGTVKGRRPLSVLLLWIFVIFFIASVCIGVVSYLVDSGWGSSGGADNLTGALWSGSGGEEQQVPEPPAEASWDRDAEAYFELELDRGFYTVGYEIPEGSYQFVCGEDTADIYWKDSGQGGGGYAFLYSEGRRKSYQELFEEECPYFPLSEVVELKDGMTVQVEGEETGTTLRGMAGTAGTLRTHEPQSGLDEIVLEDGMVAGEDFTEGVYDLVLETPENSGDYISAYVEVVDRKSDSLYVSLNSGSEYEGRYLRVPFRKGCAVTVERYDEEEDCVVRLVPSY